MKALWLLIVGILPVISCANQTTVVNKINNKLTFAEIRTNFELTDENKYGCEKIDTATIKHILRTGTLVTQREVHDYYSTTGCSIKGSMLINGKETDFTLEYGGIIYFKNVWYDTLLICFF